MEGKGPSSSAKASTVSMTVTGSLDHMAQPMFAETMLANAYSKVPCLGTLAAEGSAHVKLELEKQDRSTHFGETSRHRTKVVGKVLATFSTDDSWKT